MSCNSDNMTIYLRDDDNDGGGGGGGGGNAVAVRAATVRCNACFLYFLYWCMRVYTYI